MSLQKYVYKKYTSSVTIQLIYRMKYSKKGRGWNSMKIQRENKQQEYETIVKREKELEEMIYHAILPEYYEEWTELMKKDKAVKIQYRGKICL